MAWEVRWAVAAEVGGSMGDSLFSVPTNPVPMVGDIIEQCEHPERRWRVVSREFTIDMVDAPSYFGPPVGTVYSNVIVFVEPVS